MTAGVKEKYDRLIAEGLVPQKRLGHAGGHGTGGDGDFAGAFSILDGAGDFGGRRVSFATIVILNHR